MEVFQAFAYCLVDWLFGAGYLVKRKPLVYLAWTVVVVEVGCFVYGLL